jgi:ABC-type branched-subunit amino acid transport system substrate-binding protein
LIDTNINQIPANAQAVQLAADGVTAGEIVLALSGANITLPLFGQVDVGSPQLVQVAKVAANGLVFVSPGPAPRDVGATAFSRTYQALAGFPPGPRAVLAYDATHILLDSIEQTMLNGHQPTRTAVTTVITGIRRTGISGNIAFDAQGRRLNAPVWVYQISKEEYPGTLITP